jgi:hypothetical protein
MLVNPQENSDFLEFSRDLAKTNGKARKRRPGAGCD